MNRGSINPAVLGWVWMSLGAWQTSGFWTRGLLAVPLGRQMNLVVHQSLVVATGEVDRFESVHFTE